MISRKALSASALALIFGCGGLLRAGAQGAPFTIHMPPDGATVRETVAVQVPSASISPGGFVSVYIDGKFQIALAPREDSTAPYFTYYWDTKDLQVPDGEHSITLRLFEPSADSGNKDSVDLAGTTQVKVDVANIIHDGPSELRLRYRYPEGLNFLYNRNASSVIVGSVSDAGVSGNIPIASANSKLLLDIEDGSEALVRSKLTNLSLLSGGQQTDVPRDALTSSVYQVLDVQGNVHYEYGGSGQLAAYAQSGVPLDGTLNLPALPEAPVQVGQTWNTPDQRIVVPGQSGSRVLHVTLHNKLVDLEWQNGYPAAKIHQTYESGKGGHVPHLMELGGILIQNPHFQFSRDIYIAYTAGRLVKISQKVTVKGDTSANLQQGVTGGMGRGMGAMGRGMGGMGGYPGMPGGMGGYPGMPGGMGRPGMGGMPGGPGMGYPGMPGGMGRPGMGGRGGMGGFPGAPGMGGGFMGAGAQAATHPVTVLITTVTSLSKVD